MLRRNIEPTLNYSQEELMMSNELFTNVLSQTPELPATVVKANKLAAANIEKLTAWQIETVKSYIDLGLGRLKAAAEVTDSESLQAFYNDQLAVAKTVQEKLVNDSKALGELSADIKADIEKLVQESTVELTPKASKPASRKAA